MNPAANCTHLMPSGQACQSPAVRGTTLCYHHTALQTAAHQTAELKQSPFGGWQPLPFVFPEDRAALQINYFVLLQAFNAQAIDLRTFNALHRLLRSMATNLGKTPLTANPAETETDGGPLKQSLSGEQGCQPTPDALSFRESEANRGICTSPAQPAPTQSSPMCFNEEQSTPASTQPTPNEPDFLAHPFKNLIPDVVHGGSTEMKDLTFLLERSRLSSEHHLDEANPR